jgi:DNA-binding IclR family transcriptional regulator
LAKRKIAIASRKGEKDYRFNTALARGLSVLKAFAPDNRPIGNTEIALRVGLPKATVSRLTFTLTELGYLKYDEDIGRYSLGPGVLSLGYDVLAQMEIGDIARPYLQELAEYADASVYLGVPHGTEIIYILACRSPATMAIRLGVASRIPLPTTGMGRAYLGALPAAERTDLLARIAPVYGDNWPEIERRMTESLCAAEKTGFAVNEGDWISESNSAGAVIRNNAGRPVYGINVGGLRSIITRERLENDLGPRLVGVARQIEHAARMSI